MFKGLVSKIKPKFVCAIKLCELNLKIRSPFTHFWFLLRVRLIARFYGNTVNFG